MCGACLPSLAARLALPPGVPIGLPGELPVNLLQLEWAAPYSGVTRKALHGLKYGGDQRLAEPLGQAIAARWRRAGVGGDLLVPVPIHEDRLRWRGYDQAHLLAVVAGQESGLPVAPVLLRTRATTAQFDLDRVARAGNVTGAFQLRPRRGTPLAAEPLAGRWPVLVDDVVTTGATLSACAAVLLAAGAMGVSAVAVARER